MSRDEDDVGVIWVEVEPDVAKAQANHHINLPRNAKNPDIGNY